MLLNAMLYIPFWPCGIEELHLKSQFAMGRRLYGAGSIEILTILSLPHRLHLTGKSLTSVVGSNHNTVCLPHAGQRKRRWSTLFSTSCCFSCNCYHPVFCVLCSFQIKKPAPESLIAILGTGSKAQAQIQLMKHVPCANSHRGRVQKAALFYWLAARKTN